jgi:hypothetical protein
MDVTRGMGLWLGVGYGGNARLCHNPSQFGSFRISLSRSTIRTQPSGGQSRLVLKLSRQLATAEMGEILSITYPPFGGDPGRLVLLRLIIQKESFD